MIQLEASVEVVQEFAHVLVRRGVDRSSAVAQAREVSAQCLLHAFDEDVLARALALTVDDPSLGMRDAVHAATALHADIGRIVSADRVFEGVDRVERVDPLDPGTPWHN
jgi:predicted nucleic acid-binding protein